MLATRCVGGQLVETLFCCQEIFIISFSVLLLNIQFRKQILKKSFSWKFIVPNKVYSLTSLIHSLEVQPHLQIVICYSFKQNRQSPRVKFWVLSPTSFNIIARITDNDLHVGWTTNDWCGVGSAECGVPSVKTTEIKKYRNKINLKVN